MPAKLSVPLVGVGAGAKQKETAQMFLVEMFRSRAVKRAPGAYIFSEGDLPRPMIVIEGWVSLQRILDDGRRQIFDLALAGDFVGSFDNGRVEFDAVCLTSVKLAEFPTVTTENPVVASANVALRTAMHQIDALKQTVTLNHLLRLGRLTSFERVGHFLLEIEHRLRLTGSSFASIFALPLTQEVLADYLGLSVVHTNRTLQLLKRESLIERDGNIITLTNPGALAQICHYAMPFSP